MENTKNSRNNKSCYISVLDIEALPFKLSLLQVKIFIKIYTWHSTQFTTHSTQSNDVVFNLHLLCQYGFSIWCVTTELIHSIHMVINGTNLPDKI